MTYKLYAATCTQRRATAFGLIGFDYPAIIAYANLMRIKINPVIMNRLQRLEERELEKGAERNVR